MNISMNNISDLLNAQPVNQENVPQTKDKKEEKKTDFDKKFVETEDQKTKKTTEKPKKDQTELEILALLQQAKTMFSKVEHKKTGEIDAIESTKQLDDIKKQKELKQLKELKEMAHILSQFKKDGNENEEQGKKVSRVDLEKIAKELKQIPKEALHDAHIHAKETKQATVKLGKVENQTVVPTAAFQQPEIMKQETVLTPKTMSIQDMKEFLQTEASDVKFQVNNSKSITIQLNPDHLGKVEVRLEKVDDGMAIEIKFEKIDSRVELEAAMEEFKEEMKKNEIDLMVNIEWDNKEREQKEKEQKDEMKKPIKEEQENNETFETIFEQEVKG